MSIETTMPTRAVDTESRSQGRRVTLFIKSTKIKRLGIFALRERFSRRKSPAPEQSTQEIGKSENAVTESNQPTSKAKSDEDASSPAGVDVHISGSTSLVTAGGVNTAIDIPTKTLQDVYGPTATSKSCTSLACANVEEENRGASRQARNILRKSLRRLSVIVGKRRAVTSASKTLLANLPSTLGNEPSPPGEKKYDRKDAYTICPHIKDDQEKSVDARGAERTATESEEMERLRRDLSDYQSQVSELQKRCEAQSRDLECSNDFLNTADKSSDLDIILALHRLNAEIQQNATYMADCLVEDFDFKDVTTNLTEEQTSVLQRVSDHIGQVLAKSLRTKMLEDISMLLQISFQAYLASILYQTASSWCFEPGHNTFMDGVYQRLRKVEPQAISGRWRSLAHGHILHTWIAHPDSLIKGIISGISDILLAAGCTAPQSDITSKVASKFWEKIILLVGLAERLNKMFNDVISSDFEVFYVQPGEKFEGNNMEDMDDDQSGVQEGPVLCATHLGLIKQMPVGTLWERGKKQKMIVLKAKVLLESFLTAVE